MNQVVKRFADQYAFLSNMTRARVYHEDYKMYFDSVENGYQASKNPDMIWVNFCQSCTPHESKTQSRSVPLRKDWEDVKVLKMIQLVRSKFEINDQMRDRLILLKDMILIEGNYWNDDFWGVCDKNGKGKNVLGQILMLIRDKIIQESEISDEMLLSHIQYLHKKWF